MDDLLVDVPAERLAAVRAGLGRLTPRETEVLKRAIAGDTAIETGRMLGISARTVELHRQRAMTKLGVRSLVQAVRMIALVQRSGT